MFVLFARLMKRELDGAEVGERLGNVKRLSGCASYPICVDANSNPPRHWLSVYG